MKLSTTSIEVLECERVRSDARMKLQCTSVGAGKESTRSYARAFDATLGYLIIDNLINDLRNHEVC